MTSMSRIGFEPPACQSKSVVRMRSAVLKPTGKESKTSTPGEAARIAMRANVCDAMKSACIELEDHQHPNKYVRGASGGTPRHQGQASREEVTQVLRTVVGHDRRRAFPFPKPNPV